MEVPVLEPKHVRRVAARALTEAGLPLRGMAEVFVTSILNQNLGSTVRTRVNGTYELILDNIANEPLTGSTESFEEHVAHEATMNLLRAIAGEDYHEVCHNHGQTIIISLGRKLAEAN